MTLSVDILHGGEQQNVTDGCGIGQQHHETVDTEAQAAGRGHYLSGFETLFETFQRLPSLMAGALDPQNACVIAIVHQFGVQLVYIGVQIMILYTCSSKTQS